MSSNATEISNGQEPERETKLEPNTRYSDKDEEKLAQWISLMTGSKLEQTGQQGFYEWLKDGQVLAKLMNEIDPGAYVANSPSKSRLPAKRAMLERENINYFISAVRYYGVPTEDLFQIAYLYEQENMYQVQLTLVLLKALYEKKLRSK